MTFLTKNIILFITFQQFVGSLIPTSKKFYPQNYNRTLMCNLDAIKGKGGYHMEKCQENTLDAI